MAGKRGAKRRYRSFDETHRELINSAVSLIAEKGVDALSIAALAREIGIERTTVYYHFKNRDSLIEEVKAWAKSQIAEAFRPDRPRDERIEQIFRFVLENPELIKMWIDDFLATGDIRQRYPRWDDLVDGIREHLRGTKYQDTVDPEVVCINLLTSAFISPRVYKNSVRPDADIADIVGLFKAESFRMLESLSLEGWKM